MAVNFRVPSSPTKSIFEIDTFLGVDLTNSGTNIDENRSPNAPNMVRYVPGKVRKRTGYSTDTVFGNGLNTNLAIGADDKEYSLTIKSDEYTVLYKLFMPKDSEKDQTCYFEFDYMSEGRFWLPYAGWISASPDEFTHYKKKVMAAAGTGTGEITIVSSQSYPEQEVKFKNFSFMFDQDENYVWHKAPKYFVYRETNDPVYGCHIIKKGTFDGNRVVNVNRALGTSPEYITETLTTSKKTLYTLGDYVYPGRKVFVDFVYEGVGDNVVINIVGKEYTLEPSDVPVTFSEEIVSNRTEALNLITVVSNGVSTFKFKEFSLTYEKDDYYAWNVAPEDIGEKFYIEDTFFSETKNYSIIEEVNDTSNISSGKATVTATLGNSTTNVLSYSHIKFSLHTASYKPLSSLKVELVSNTGETQWERTYTDHLLSEEFNIYVGTGGRSKYIEKIVITYSVSGSSTSGTACWTSIKGITVNKVTPRTSYAVSSKYYVYHTGNDIYLKVNNGTEFTKVYSGANASISSSWQLGDMLFILDGKNIYSYAVGDSTVKPLADGEGYIPTITIGKSPKGGGNSYDDINMIQPAFYEMFYVSESENQVTTFFLSFGELDSTPVKAWVLNSNGSWVEKEEGSDFIVNRGTGMIDFFSSPGTSPLTGEDNVKILAYRTVPGYKERITNCTIGTLFGVNGAADRLFLSGNPDYPNYDWYSEQYDPTYFPDTGYSALGLSSSAIVGYAIVNNYLATFKDEYEPSQSVFIRSGDTMTDESTGILRSVFKLINTLQGNGVIAPRSFGYMQTEPLFLTRSGIYAITAQDITGEKYAQNRSFYLNGALTQEPNLEKAYAVVYDDMYILALNNKLYILDGLQPTRTDKSEPYATRQYVAFLCTDVPANCMWTDEQALWFGTEDGHICRFATDKDDLESYNDDGKAISCCWETPDLDGKLFYKNKSFRYIAIRMMSALRTSVKLWSMARGAWNFIKEDVNTGIFFDFEHIDFEAFSFSTDRTDKVAHSKIRVKKVDKAKFKIENSNVNEPFGLMNLALEYIESGNFKG